LTAIILQARLDSARLPGKAMLPLDNKPLLYRVMQALNHVPAGLRVLACPQDSFCVFEPLAQEAGFEIFSGPKEDVLERYCQVIKNYNIDRVIRATGDNPFVFADAAISINNEAMALNADYACFQNLPYGSGVESVLASSLLRAGRDANSLFEREHVCPHLYNNPLQFMLHRPFAPERWNYPDLRLTVDTQEDYKRAVILYAALKDTADKYSGTVIINNYLELLNSRRIKV